MKKAALFCIFQVRPVLKGTARRIAVMMQEWEYRYYSSNSRWSQGEEISSKRDGSGNEFYILFREKSCCVKVIDKEISNTRHILKETEKLQGREREVLDYFLTKPAFEPV
ncbi:MAG TPA: hypothetical protein PK453_05830 [Leptospiraceae bacterium]|nr:hypothetical protein [Leptospiraceae bacterium]